MTDQAKHLNKGDAGIPGCLDSLVLLGISALITFLLYLRQFSVLTSSIVPDQSGKVALIGIAIQTLVLSLVLIPLALFWKSPLRNIYQAWLMVNFLTLMFSPAYLLKMNDEQLRTLFQIIAAIIFLFLIPYAKRLLPNYRKDLVLEDNITTSNPKNKGQIIPIITILIIAIGIPWFALGALGSLLDTISMIVLGLMIGIISTSLFWSFIYDNVVLDSGNKWGTIFIAGLGTSILLLLIAGALGFNFGGIQLLEMLLLPGLGWLIVLIIHLEFHPGFQFSKKDLVIVNRIRLMWPYAFLIGTVCAYPLIFVDPDELVLVLNSVPGEILFKASQADLLSASITFFFILIFVALVGITGRNSKHEVSNDEFLQSKWVEITLSMLAFTFIIGGCLIYFLIGQPGFFGDRIFVILREQSDLSSISQIQDYDQRRDAVYKELVDKANKNQKGIRDTLDRFGIKYTPYYLVNAIVINDNPLIRLWLNSRPEVDRILDDPLLRPLPDPLLAQPGDSELPVDTLWNISMTGADKVWEEFRVKGAGIIIGQSDSGVQGDHPELADSYRGNEEQNDYSWIDPWNHTTTPTDIGGHGTHTLGTILGNNTGIAPDAQWIGCVNLARNLSNPSYYLDCMQFMLAPYPQVGNPFTDGKPSLGAQILNNSWGCPDIEGCDATVFEPAVRALKTAGIFVVASAGNDGPKCASLIVPPPIYEETFAVGAIDKNDNLANFSSIGPVTVLPGQPVKPDILAPGIEILSSLPDSTYGIRNGTSMAGPHVVGTVALMWSANPKLVGDIDLTTQYLTQSAKPYLGPNPDCPGVGQLPSTASGYGVLDAYEAVKLALEYEK
jgi:hypothetical protein